MKAYLKDILLSPVDGSLVNTRGNNIVDTSGNLFPIIDDVPILINNNNSIFQTTDYFSKDKIENKYNSNSFKKQIINFLIKAKPSVTLNFVSGNNYKKLFNDLSKISQPKVLIIGAGESDGVGLNTTHSNLSIIKTDVVLSPYIDVVCDAHQLPFKSGCFDAVIVQAVLEHVVDPPACVNEIHRVLKDDGIVYAETPFMQQVHMGRYDFTRFTHLGHRRLFNQFDDIESGPVCGPAVALTWSLKYFIRSCFRPSIFQLFFEWFFTFFYFWLKYFDFIIIKKQASFDASSGFYFYGKKSKCVLADKDLISKYKGIIV